MNITTLINAIRDALKGSATINTWCNTNYSQDLTLYKGLDERNPPDSDDYPVAHLYPINKVGGYDLEESEHGIGITVGLYDETLTTTTDDDYVLKEYRGVDRLEAFRKLVETAALGAVSSPQWAAEIRIEYETVEFFPFFLANMELRVTDPYYQGDDAFK